MTEWSGPIKTKWLNIQKLINVTHRVNGLKKNNHRIISVHAEKSFEKNTAFIPDKISQQTRS